MQQVENDPELTEEMLVQQLTEACEEQIKALWGTSRAHENLFGPLDAEREQESDTLLRLRKVYCHAIAVTSCPMDEWAIHAMAPDIRAALAQLKTLVRDGVCAEVHEPGERGLPHAKMLLYVGRVAGSILTPHIRSSHVLQWRGRLEEGRCAVLKQALFVAVWPFELLRLSPRHGGVASGSSGGGGLLRHSQASQSS